MTFDKSRPSFIVSQVISKEFQDTKNLFLIKDTVYIDLIFL